MKIQHLISILFLAAFFTVSAQTSNTLATANTPALLTTNQAELLAIQLASNELQHTYWGPSQVSATNVGDVMIVNISDTNSLNYNVTWTATSTRIIDGHWISQLAGSNTNISTGHFDGVVEIALDGSTNSVRLPGSGVNMIPIPNGFNMNTVESASPRR